MTKRYVWMSLIAAAAVLPAPALADVKAGVDAWAKGDYATAVREWQGPADKGDADAQFNLGQAYKLGRGVKTDLRKAEELFGRAAEKNHLQASDMYGLLLFQRGERAKALPYVRAAADRGEPRAQYLLGVAHFNGDTVPKDWVRAYALASLAQQAGIEQAKSALAQMDQYIPLDQRQQGVALARELASQADATRARQMAAVDLGSVVPVAASTGPAPVRGPVPRASTASTAVDAAAVARVAAENSPRYAGADYARPQAPPPRPAVSGSTAPMPTPRPASPIATTPAPRPLTVSTAAPPPPPPPPRATAPAARTGAWRVQLGAFSVAANANALWAKVKDRPELAGHGRESGSAGSATKLFAGGFASREAAQSACSRLTAAGFACLVVRN
jgi:cell division septation protein DedD